VKYPAAKFRGFDLDHRIFRELHKVPTKVTSNFSAAEFDHLSFQSMSALSEALHLAHARVLACSHAICCRVRAARQS
jgi:hypothetical protein